METIADFIQLIIVMRSELEQQVVALKKLAVIFAEGNVQLIRHGQVTRLRILESRIMGEVENIKRMESAAQMGSTKGALLGGGVAFIIGSLFMAARGRKDAAHVGARMASSVLNRKVPFGTVLMVIGKEGIPEDVKVVSISRLARESSRSESEVVANFKNNGYLSMTPETLTHVLDKVERGILDGSLSLPINIDELTKHIPEVC